MKSRTQVVLALGSAQTLAWASTFYLPTLLAVPMARDLGVATPTVFAVLSMALIVSALIGPQAGHWIDRRGGRPVLLGSGALFVAGLLALGLAQGPVGLVAAWLLLGLGMGCGLYDSAFASLVRLYGNDARPAITGITLIAGFASTVGWPLTALMEAQWGWRGACFGWAALHVLLGWPLNARLPRVGAPAAVVATPVLAIDSAAAAPVAQTPTAAPSRHTLPLVALLFALTGFVSTAMATHLPTLLQASGATLATAVAVAALVGPAQVAARLFEFGVLRRFSVLYSARAATLGHPLGAALLLALGAAGALPFVVLHGLGNGLLTIVKGTLPLAVFGATGYGARQGWIALPARVLGALSPWLFGLVIARWGAGALWLTAVLGAAAFVVLMMLRLPQPATPGRPADARA
jgi:predicted MFS family arabinose efflux permease